MKTYRKLLGIILLATLTISCDKNGKDNAGPKSSSSSTSVNGGNSSSGNDNKGDTKGEDYGDLYVLHRDEQGVPIMGYKLLLNEEGDSYEGGVWYPEVLAFDNGVLVVGEVLEVNEYGELSVDNYYEAAEVDLGRINIVRSPQRVLISALSEAISAFEDVEMISTDASGRLVAVHGEGLDWLTGEEDDKTIDSPRENMAVYKELMLNGFGGQLDFLLGEDDIQTTIKAEDLLTLAASAFAAGSDKTGTILTDEIIYVNNIINVPDESPLTVFTTDYNSSLVYEADSELETEGLEFDCTTFDNYEYFNKLRFYNFQSYVYNRSNEYYDKLLLIRDINDDEGTVTKRIERVYNEVEFTLIINNQKGLELSDMGGFAAACDDAVQVLEYIHESSLVEYIGEYPNITDEQIADMEENL